MSDKHIIWERIEDSSIRDIAYRMGRAPRWAGATEEWWSVLDHSLFCEALSRKYLPDYPEYNFHCLVHDCHEFASADVPKPFVCDCLTDIQTDIDYIIFTKYNFPHRTPDIKKHVDHIDWVAREIERESLLHQLVDFPEEFSHFLDRSPLETIYRSGRIVDIFVKKVNMYLKMFGNKI